MEEGIAPTDSRLRPDQRLMEEGRWEESNQEKIRYDPQFESDFILMTNEFSVRFLSVGRRRR